MTEKIVETIRSRSREEYRQNLFEKWTDLRIWVQENGEVAAIMAFVGGIFLVVAFKLVIALTVIGGLLGYVVWYIALPEGETLAAPATATDEVSSVENLASDSVELESADEKEAIKTAAKKNGRPASKKEKVTDASKNVDAKDSSEKSENKSESKKSTTKKKSADTDTEGPSASK